MNPDAAETVDPIDAGPRIRQDRAPRTPRRQLSGAAKRKLAAERTKPAARSKVDNADVLAQLEVVYRMAASTWQMVDPVCGGAAAQAIPRIIGSWEMWMESNPNLATAMAGYLSPAGPLAVIAAHLPIVAAVMAHHGPGAKAQRQAEQSQPGPTGPAGTVDVNGYDADGVYWGKPEPVMVDPYADGTTTPDPAWQEAATG